MNDKASGTLALAVPAIQSELARYSQGVGHFVETARGSPDAPEPVDNYVAIDSLNRAIRSFAAAQFRPGMPYAEANLVASLIEEADFAASLGETLFQMARRVEREKFESTGQALLNPILDEVDAAMQALNRGTGPVDAAARLPTLAAMRENALTMGAELPSTERGSILTLLGSAERAFLLIDRIEAERRSVTRTVHARAEAAQTSRDMSIPGALPA